jgi:hypothetical protein
METRIIEFEEYLAALSASLHVDASVKEDICCEIGQNLYDKYDELLIKGYGIEQGIACTLESFEVPEVLAGMFNEIHGTSIDLRRAIVFLQNRKVLLAALVATLLLAFVI